MKYRVTLVTLIFLLVCSLSTWAEKRLDNSDEKKTTAKIEQTASTAAAATIIPQSGEATELPAEVLEFAPETVPFPEIPTEAAAAYAVPWKSINGGGGNASTATHKVSVSIGQTTIGFATTATHQAGIGYWYGIDGTAGCDCGVQGDMNCDGNVQPVDVTFLINLVYRSRDDICNAPNCPYVTGDLDCNTFLQPVDVVYLINYVFRSRNDICDGCAPTP